MMKPCSRSLLAIVAALLSASWLLVVPPPVRASGDDAETAVRVSFVLFSPDGKQLAIGFGERNAPGGLLVVDARDYTRVKAIPEEAGVSSIAYSPDGKWLAYTVFSQGPRLLSTADFRQQARLPNDRRGPISFSPDSRLLAMAHTEGSVALYDVEKQADAFQLKNEMKNIMLAVFSHDGKRLVAGGDGGGTLWDVEAKKALHRFRHGRSVVTSARFSPDDSQFATAGWDGTLRLWSTEGGAPLGRVELYANRIAVSDTARLLAVASNRPTLEVFQYPFGALGEEQADRLAKIAADWETGDYETREQATESAFKLGLAALPRLHELSESSPSAEVRVRARYVLQQLREHPQISLDGHWNEIASVGFSPDGKHLASGSLDGTVRIWDPQDGTQLHVLHPREMAAAH